MAQAGGGAAGEAAAVKWPALKRDYAAETAANAVRQVETSDHPLTLRRLRHLMGDAAAVGLAESPGVADVAEQEDGEVDIDPLSAMAMMDPLSTMAAAGSGSSAKAFSFASRKERKRGREDKDEVEQDARVLAEERRQAAWNTHKAAIMRAHSASGKIRVKSSFLTSVSNDEENTLRAMDRARQRLEQLEKTEEQDSVELSNQEMMASVSKHRTDLERSWKRAERVKSLKIAIQCAKLLLETSVPQFYPAIFVHATDVLDTFGTLVFKRIFARAEESLKAIDGPGKRLSESFTASDISSEAKETCRNWIFKTACIRELLPRLYIEMALLKCNRFLSSDAEFPVIVARLYNSIRGIGDVMVAAFARTYLARCAAEVLGPTQLRERALLGMQDYCLTFEELKSERRQLGLAARGLDFPQYVGLMSEAVQWQVAAVAEGSNRDAFTTLLQKYRTNCNDTMLLKHILASFSAKLYNNKARSMVALINEADASHVPKAECFAVLADALLEFPPPVEQRLPLLNDAWRVITHVENPAVYINCVSSFIALVLKHYEVREVIILLTDCARHMKDAAQGGRNNQQLDEGEDEAKLAERPAKLPAAAEEGMQRVISQLLESEKLDFAQVFTSDAMVQMLDLFSPKQKLTMSKRLLEHFTKTQDATNDPVLIHTLFDVARTLHDSLDSLSVEDERRQIAKLICRFVDKIDFGRDLEQQLNTLVDCRAMFSNLDSVKDRLVMAASQLAMNAHKLMNGTHTRKTSGFVKACFAFCHITIPSIDTVMARLERFLLCGQTALMNGCLPQADTFFKAAIQDVAEVAQGSEEVTPKFERSMRGYLLNFIATMVVVPGHPDHGPFYLARGLVSALERFPWLEASKVQTEVYIGLLALLCTYAQDKLPYHVKGIESNDLLYGGDPAFAAELETLTSSVMDAILGQLGKLSEDGSQRAKKVQTELVVQLVDQIVTGVKVTSANGSLVVHLFKLVQKNDASNSGLAAVVDVVKQRAARVEMEDAPEDWQALKTLATALTA